MMGDPPTVTFNVGGTSFTTSRETLFREPSSRLALIAKEAIPCHKDTRGSFTIDRDGKHFSTILNFLRDGWALLPGSSELKRELLQEIRYYQLSGMEGWLRTQEVVSGSAIEAASEQSPRVHGQYDSRVSALALPMPGTASATGFATGLLSPQAPYAINGRAVTSVPAALPGYAGATQRAAGRVEAAMTHSGVIESLRDAFLRATGPQRPTSPVAAFSISQGGEGGTWTSKYLRSNEGLRDLVNTLLELAYVPPARAMHSGKVSVSVSVACDHERLSSLVASQEDRLRTKNLDVRVQGSGWVFSFTLRPSSEPALWDKYTIAGAVQDNWFVLGAILKDQFGVILEEDSAARSPCVACRRTNLAITLTKIY